VIADTPTLALPTVSFAQLPPGWHHYPGVPGLAVSWAYRPNSAGWAPSMPRNGIAVSVFFVNDARRLRPLRLVVPRSPATTLEGAPDTPEYRIEGSVDGHDVDVFIDIRRRRPTRGQLRVVQRVLDAVHFR
jgi:hypothetical protein